jgi:thiol-disulfide isomerase/thioredoxin
MKTHLNKSIVVVMLAVFLSINCVQDPQVSTPDDIESDHSVELDADTFDSLLLKDSCTGVVEFYSPTCMTCQAIRPLYDSIGMIFGDSLLVARVNADAQAELCKTYAITVVPSFVFFSGGTVVRVESMTADGNTFDTLSDRVRKLFHGTLTPLSTDTAGSGDTIPGGYLTLDSLSFDSTVLRPGRVAMVFFIVPAGYSCIIMDSVVSAIVPQFDGRAVIAKVVVVWDVEPLYQRYGITSTPRFLFFKDGEQVVEEQRGGVVEGDTLAAVLERLLEE